ncbi:hypothetical protein ASD42_27885 [Nocardia sp. Root136]|nr:hypothetical protein ASD42_27885 [Nocardia sp. Root136]
MPNEGVLFTNALINCHIYIANNPKVLATKMMIMHQAADQFDLRIRFLVITEMIQGPSIGNPGRKYVKIIWAAVNLLSANDFADSFQRTIIFTEMIQI